MIPLGQSGLNTKLSVCRPIRWPTIAPLCSASAITAGSMDGPQRSRKIRARIYSGVDLVMTRKICPTVWPKLPKNFGEINGKNSKVKTPAPTSAIWVRMMVAIIPGKAWSINKVDIQVPKLAMVVAFSDSETRSG